MQSALVTEVCFEMVAFHDLPMPIKQVQCFTIQDSFAHRVRIFYTLAHG